MNGRYEITEIKIHGDEYGPRRIRITSPDGSWDEIDQSDDGKVRLEDVIIGAIRQLQSDLAAVSAERDLLAREISEADDLARHFVRDRPTLRARGAIVLQADEIAKLRAAAPQPQVAVTDAICDRVADRINHGAFEARPWAIAKRYLEEFQSELGPALGLAAWREPTEEECVKMCSILTDWEVRRIDGFSLSPQGITQAQEAHGRAMFEAVREVMGGAE